MNKSVVSWGLVVILGISTFLLWAYANELNNKVNKLESSNNSGYFIGIKYEIERYELLLVYEKAYVTEGRTDFELFTEINPLFLSSGASFLKDFDEETDIEMNQYQSEINSSIILFRKALTNEERQKHINTFENSLIKYKEKYYQLAKSSGYCSDYSTGFCPE